jgi:hypothetical protein
MITLEPPSFSPFDSVPRSRRAAALAPPPESSQMFTLAALVGRASSTPPPPPERKVAKKEGSGVIDLNALARAAEERMKRSNSEPPLAAFARETRSLSDEAPIRGRRLRFVGIGAAALLLATIGIVVATVGTSEPTPHARAATATPSQQVEQPTKATPEQQLAPIPLTNDDKANKDAAQAPRVGKGRGKGHARAVASKFAKVASPGTNVSSKPPPPAKPAAGSDPCGCKGDLQCAIKCFK